MEVLKWLIMCLTCYMVISSINETHAHPISWLTTINPRPKRSFAEVDIPFYPGVTLVLKDALRIDDLGKLAREEETENGSNEDIIIRLLEDEHEFSMEESTEFSSQKHINLEIEKPLTHFQNSVERIELPSQELDLDSIWDNTPSGHPDRTNFESTTYTTENLGIFGPENPELNNLPQDIYTRLHSIDKSPSSDEYFDQFSLEAQPGSLRHDTDVNYQRSQKDFNSNNHQAVLPRRLLNHQKQTKEDNMKFLIEKKEDINKIRQDYDFDGNISEAQLDWEEYHEYDA
ncbi:hypothetical protein SK128_021025 [Halocaridina rubra]|uniref:Uncharacterized protein n=1 Tax=Halocaridina rubra TaxID=373956 RepID=A0AAN8WVA3_HALRR